MTGIHAQGVAVGAKRLRPESPADFRALYLYNFAKYTEWPAGTFQSEDKFRIGVAGSDDLTEELGRALLRMLDGQELKHRSLDIQRFAQYHERSAAELARLHVLFVGKSEQNHLPIIRGKLTKVLIVTELDRPKDFHDSGATVNFIMLGNKLSFEISLSAGERAGLKFDPRLLELANRVIRSGSETPNLKNND